MNSFSEIRKSEFYERGHVDPNGKGDTTPVRFFVVSSSKSSGSPTHCLSVSAHNSFSETLPFQRGQVVILVLRVGHGRWCHLMCDVRPVLNAKDK